MTAWVPGLYSISPSSPAKQKNSFPNGPWPLCLSDLCGPHICPWPQHCGNRRIWLASLKPQATLDTDIKYPHPKLNELSVEEGWCPWKITVLLSGDRKTDTEQAKQQMSILSLRQEHTTLHSLRLLNVCGVCTCSLFYVLEASAGYCLGAINIYFHLMYHKATRQRTTFLPDPRLSEFHVQHVPHWWETLMPGLEGRSHPHFSGSHRGCVGFGKCKFL